jgi:sortase A
MALKVYRKTSPSLATIGSYSDYFSIKDIDNYSPEPINMWSLMARCYGGLKRLVASSTSAGVVIPLFFILAGIGVLYLNYRQPLIEQIKQSLNYYDQGTTPLVAGDYIVNKMQYVSNPGADYFERVSQAAANLGIDPKVKNFQGTMYLSIPALGFKRLPIKANVESSSKDIYDQVLTSAIAHFKGTSLPFASNPNNTVLYGHSASGSYNPRPDDVLAAFSFLSNLKVGDEIIIEANAQTYTYRMARSKIVSPNDFSIIDGTPGRDTLTLVTCYPPGNNTSRLAITALPTN